MIPYYILDKIIDMHNLYKYNFEDGDHPNNYEFFSAIQKCHWTCIDDYKMSVNLKAFSFQMITRLNHVPDKYKNRRNFTCIYEQYIENLRKRPGCGAIVWSKNTREFLLVQGCQSQLWVFPQGKLESEDYSEKWPTVACACREVLEETSFDISRLIDPNNFFEYRTPYGRLIRLYIIDIVTKPKNLKPKTKGEINNIRWAPLDELLEMPYTENYSIIHALLPHLVKLLRKK